MTYNVQAYNRDLHKYQYNPSIKWFLVAVSLLILLSVKILERNSWRWLYKVYDDTIPNVFWADVTKAIIKFHDICAQETIQYINCE
jgi:hypothetical protein